MFMLVLWGSRDMRSLCTDITNGIQRSVSAESEVRSRDIVADSCWYHRHRDAELGILFSCLSQHQYTLESLQNTTHPHSAYQQTRANYCIGTKFACIPSLRFNGNFLKRTLVSWYQNVSFWILLKLRMMVSVARWCSGRVLDLWSLGRRFESQPPLCRAQPWASC